MRRVLPRETHLLSGLVLQVLAIGLLVFAYTQAARQLNFQRKIHRELKEQLLDVRSQIQQASPLELEILKNRWSEHALKFLTREDLNPWTGQLAEWVQGSFGFEAIEMEVTQAPERTLGVPVTDGGADLQMDLTSIQFKGKGTTHQVARFLSALLSEDNRMPVCSLKSIQIASEAEGEEPTTRFVFQWVVAVLKNPLDPQRFAFPPLSDRWEASTYTAALPWGPREEPFQQ